MNNYETKLLQLIPESFREKIINNYDFYDDIPNRMVFENPIYLLNTKLNPTTQEILEYKINIIKRYVTRGKFLKIYIKKISPCDDISNIIIGFIGLETFSELFKNNII